MNETLSERYTVKTMGKFFVILCATVLVLGIALMVFPDTLTSIAFHVGKDGWGIPWVALAFPVTFYGLNRMAGK